MSSPAPWRVEEPAETLALDASEGRRSLSAFLISGMLMAFLGAILPAWRYHLKADFKEVGYYFLSLNLGFLLSVPAAHVLLPRKGAEVRVDGGERHRLRRLPLPGAYIASSERDLATAGSSVDRHQRRAFEHRSVSRHLSAVPA